MKRLRRLIVWLARLWHWRKNRNYVKRAMALNVELERIEFRVHQARARETAVRRLTERYPPAAVAAIADVRGFGNLARIVRGITREIRRDLAA